MNLYRALPDDCLNIIFLFTHELLDFHNLYLSCSFFSKGFIISNTLKITEESLIKQNFQFENEDYKKHLFKWFAINEIEI